MIRLALLASLGLLVTAPPNASAAVQAYYCSEPIEPYCIDAYGTFENDYSFQSCRRDVQNYLSDVADYEQCVIDEVRRVADEAQMDVDNVRREAEDALERFNCKAEGNSFCY
mgnify:CR=1 FL=1|tara:strand:- start:757 stop:1092 length:336 start_codon:yes stop_codon:yes gene_type:complete